MPPFPPCEAVIPMSAQEYLVERDNAAFRGLLAEVMQLGEVEVVETWRDGDIRYEKEVQKPDYDRWVPKIGRKLIKNRDDLDFYDIIRYDPDLLDKPPYQLPLQVEREVIIEAIDENHCRHRIQGEVHSDAKFGIGKLAEHMVIDSTVKTVERLPEITERYLEVRREMMKTPEGRKALLEGVPDVVIEFYCLPSWSFRWGYKYGLAMPVLFVMHSTADIVVVLTDLYFLCFWQKPYEEPQPQVQVQEQQPPQERVETRPVVQEVDVEGTEQEVKTDEVVVEPPSPQPTTEVVQGATKGMLSQEVKTGEVIVKPPSPRPTTEVIQEVEVAPGKEAEWQCVCEACNTAAGDTAANRATVVALEEDRVEAMRHLHSLSPSKVQKVFLKDLKHSHMLSPHERKAFKHLLEDEKQLQRRNENLKTWRKFWHKCNPATCPVGNEAARIVQLVNLGSAVGLVELDDKQEVKAVVVEAEPTPKAETTPEPGTTPKEHKERLGGIKKVFEKLHLSKRHEE
ncbi:hypothetical protein COCOBI_16-1970 [Coccomyxa sp. Obi]|nr:hypothetical protein COCOBI_16-1970 [Coccomyxa sp. Obi]